MQVLSCELAAVLGPIEVLVALARACPNTPVIPLDVDGLALLPVPPELADQVTPAALCALPATLQESHVAARGLRERGFPAPSGPWLPGGTPYSARRRRELLTGPESGFAVLTPGLAALVEAASTIGPVAYVEADHVGGTRRQAAALWQSGRLTAGPLLLGPREEYVPGTAPVDVVLRALGVVAEDGFTTVGLGRHRRTVDWVRAPHPGA